MEQLRQLEQNLIDAAKKKQEAVDAAIKAEKIYDEQWEKIAATNPEFKQTWEANNTAAVAARAAKSDYSDVKTATVKALLELPAPDDMKVVDAFNYQLSKAVKFEDGVPLIQHLAEIQAYGLLKIDSTALTKFFRDNAVKEDNNNYQLPSWLFLQYGCMVTVTGEIKPTISDPIIAKQAK